MKGKTKCPSEWKTKAQQSTTTSKSKWTFNACYLLFRFFRLEITLKISFAHITFIVCVRVREKCARVQNMSTTRPHISSSSKMAVMMVTMHKRVHHTFTSWVPSLFEMTPNIIRVYIPWLNTYIYQLHHKFHVYDLTNSQILFEERVYLVVLLHAIKFI